MTTEYEQHLAYVRGWEAGREAQKQFTVDIIDQLTIVNRAMTNLDMNNKEVDDAVFKTAKVAVRLIEGVPTK